jgi:hypothetical protein
VGVLAAMRSSSGEKEDVASTHVYTLRPAEDERRAPAEWDEKFVGPMLQLQRSK